MTFEHFEVICIVWNSWGGGKIILSLKSNFLNQVKTVHFSDTHCFQIKLFKSS